MQLHELKRKNPHKKHKTVGRGGKRGKTAGRGTKGQNARAGHKKRPELRDIIKKLPKLRGRGKNIFQSFKVLPAVVSLSKLTKAFPEGGAITPAILFEKGVVRQQGGKIPKVKILGNEKVSIKFSISECLTSVSARSAIEGGGGSVK